MLFTKEQQKKIVTAIREAEHKTSGEIKVRVEKMCPESDVMERAKKVFFYLALEKTANHNGVLIYLSLEDKKMAILGDSGIDKVVPSTFWDNTKEILRVNFSQGKLVEGLVEGILKAGEQLQTYFPAHKGDINEISDEISFG